MMSPPRVALLAVAIAFAALTYFKFFKEGSPSGSNASTSSSATDDSNQLQSDTESVSQAQSSPFDLAQNTSDQTPDQIQINTGSAESNADQGLIEANSIAVNPDYPPLNGFEVALVPFTDAALLAMAERLHNDPRLLQEVMDEFRAETDEGRLGRLKYLLGEVANPELVPLAEEMLYAGTTPSQVAALDLLRRVQDENPQARSVAMNVLSGSGEKDVLVAAMNVFSNPVNTTETERQDVVNQMLTLVDHDEASVRRHGISILSRWSGGETITPVLLQGLNDADPKVRQTSAYALVNNANSSEDAKLALLDMAENADESNGGRRAAVLALEQMSLDLQTAERVQAAKIAIRKAGRR